MKKKFAAFVLCVICLLSAAGCGQAKTDEQTPPTDQSAVTDDYLTTISGTYVELFPELSKSEYRNIWIDATTPLAGAENAETATDIIITPVISLTLTRIMYMSENKMVVADALARIDSVLEAAPMQAQAVPQHPQDASVALQNVHFSYDGKNEVIKGVSLEIQPGQTVAFVGPSGGGKSTLANLVCRFFDVQSGSVRVGGADVRAIPKEELMDTISFVFQNSRLLKGSILDNVRLGRPQATEAEVLAALKAAQCMDIVEKFPAGIHTVIGTKGVYLSGGEQQRIAIARAMLKNAPILILDEATAFADPDNEAKVQAAFARLAKGKTVLMIAHRLSTVANADCIYVVQDGQIAESGTKDELCAQNGLFARMWQEYQASVQWKVAKEG